MKRRDGGLVYSTDQGRICPNCRRSVVQCNCRDTSAPPPKGDGIVRVGRETKGRKGAGVTVIAGVPLGADELSQLAGELKRRCGSGGTVKDFVIEIQGDHRDTVVAELTRRGWKVKRSGG